MAISQSLKQSALSQLFIDARTHNSWQDKPVTDEQIKDLYELLKFAPTSVIIAIQPDFSLSKAPKQKSACWLALLRAISRKHVQLLLRPSLGWIWTSMNSCQNYFPMLMPKAGLWVRMLISNQPLFAIQRCRVLI